MNNGVYDGLNHGFSPFIESETFVGYWGDIRPVIEEEAPGNASLLTGQLGGGIINFQLTIPPFGLQNVRFGTFEEQPWKPLALELPFNAEAFEITNVGILNTSGQALTFYLDIGVGPAGKEQVILSKFLIGARFNPVGNPGLCDVCGPFPIAIPAGSRVSYRITQIGNAVSNDIARFVAFLGHFHKNYFGNSGNVGRLLPEDTIVTNIPTPGATDTESAWGSIGFLPYDTNWVVPCPAHVNLNSVNASGWVIDYGYIEPDGTVVPLIENIYGSGLSSECIWNINRPYPVDLQAGTEIVARGSFVSLGNAVSLVPGLIVIGSENVDSGRRSIGSTTVAH